LFKILRVGSLVDIVMKHGVLQKIFMGQEKILFLHSNMKISLQFTTGPEKMISCNGVQEILLVWEEEF
jgi:hypothetical protein